MTDQSNAYDAQLRALSEALAPFAEIKADDGDDFAGWHPDIFVRCEVMVGEIHAARKALAQTIEARGAPTGVWHNSAGRPEARESATQPNFAPCPFCKQYSHSIGEDKIADAFMHFHTLFAHPLHGRPLGPVFDEKTRDAAQVLLPVFEKASAALEPKRG